MDICPLSSPFYLCLSFTFYQIHQPEQSSHNSAWIGFDIVLDVSCVRTFEIHGASVGNLKRPRSFKNAGALLSKLHELISQFTPLEQSLDALLVVSLYDVSII